MAWKTLIASGMSSPVLLMHKNVREGACVTGLYNDVISLLSGFQIACHNVLHLCRCMCVSLAAWQHLHLLYPSGIGINDLKTILRWIMWMRNRFRSLVVANVFWNSRPKASQSMTCVMCHDDFILFHDFIHVGSITLLSALNALVSVATVILSRSVILSSCAYVHNL